MYADYLNDVSYLLLDKIRSVLMQISTLTKVMATIESLAQSEGKHQQLSKQIHKLSALINTLSKHYESANNQIQEGQKEIKQLRKKLKKVGGKLQKKEEQNESLQRELSSTKDIYEHKLQKLLRVRDQESWGGRQERRQRGSRRKGKEVQCEMLDSAIIKELQERNMCQLIKINQLEKELEEQKNQSHSKQLYIESLISALETQVENELEDQPEEGRTISGESRSNCSDTNDNSTIADSLKDQDPHYFADQKPEASQGPIQQPYSGWLGTLSSALMRAKRLFWG